MTATVSETKVEQEVDEYEPMRPPIDLPWDNISNQLIESFGYSAEEVAEIGTSLESDKEGLLKLYKSMERCRAFENACNQQYMQGKIRGFMHLDNGQESIPGLVDYALKKEDKKISYYREHTHAIASGVDMGEVMAE